MALAETSKEIYQDKRWEKFLHSELPFTPDNLSRFGFEGFDRYTQSRDYPQLWVSNNAQLDFRNKGKFAGFLVAPSGAGKDALITEVIEECPSLICRVVTATDRPMRPEEIDGIHYYFLSQKEFTSMIPNELAEWSLINNGPYRGGIPKLSIKQAMSCAQHPIFRINIKGAMKARNLINIPSISVGLLPEMSLLAYIRRLEELRPTDADSRLKKALEEIPTMGLPIAKMDFFITNPIDTSGKPKKATEAFHFLLHTLSGISHEEMIQRMK
jgi:guanylate kinase